MALRIEEQQEKQPILLINKRNTVLATDVKRKLLAYNTEIYSSALLPKDISNFEHIFIFDDFSLLKSALEHKHRSVIFIGSLAHSNIAKINQNKQGPSRLRIILAHDDHMGEEKLDQMFWFIFSHSKEVVLDLRPQVPKKIVRTQIANTKQLLPKITFPRIFFSFLFFLVIAEFSFIPFLALSYWHTYQGVKEIRSGNLEKMHKESSDAAYFLQITKTFYTLPHSTLLLFSAALLPDTIIDINQKVIQTLDTAYSLQTNAKYIFTLLFQQSKTQQEINQLELRLTTLKGSMQSLSDNLSDIYQKIPIDNNQIKKIKDQISQYIDLLTKTQKIIEQSDWLFAKNSERKFLIMFANNMELRPGGGFIGSFGIVKVRNYTIDPITVYDVYDADGQLKAHIDPPEPIKKYLNVQHWFLRDSAFTPDFVENFAQAKLFLDREMNERNFDGGMLVTTTAVQNILTAFPNIYLSGYDEQVNASNFYIKTQYYAEKNFFPGSAQKKNFLSSLVQGIFVNLDQASEKDLAAGIKKSLDEKQVVAYVEYPKLQQVLDNFYWSGRQIKPTCSQELKNCIVDYIFPVEANVGANKANFFVNRSLTMRVTISPDGSIRHIVTIKFENNSPSEVYPGGIYNNYFQLYLPPLSAITSITKNGTMIDNVEQTDGDFKKVAFPVYLKPHDTANVEIVYRLNESVKKGNGIYQLIVQKQIGLPSHDLSLNITLPDNIHLINQNFSPLVNHNQILYNTSLSTDKVFYVELLKE